MSLTYSRSRATIIALTAAAGLLVAGLSEPPARAESTVTLFPVRTIGAEAPAGLYAWGVAYDPLDDTILVGDYWNFRVVRLNTDGTSAGPDPVTTANKGSANNQDFDALLHQSAYGLAVDPTNGDFYFGDVDGGKTVDKYGRDGGEAILAFGGNGAGPNKFKYPSRVAIAPNRDVYVMDQWDHTISVHDTDSGAELFSFGGNGAGDGQFKQPRGAAFTTPTPEHPLGKLYVADNYNGRVQIFDAATGAFLGKFGSKGSLPGQFGLNPDLRGVAIDNDNGWVYVSNASSAYINKYDLDGNFLLRFGGYEPGDGVMKGGPREIAVDGEGNVWVGDMPGFRVVKFDSDGNYLLESPSPAEPPALGGFNQPRGVAVDSAGRIIVSDTHNWRIEVFDPAGEAVDQWGNRGGGGYGFNYQRGVAVDRRSAEQTAYPDAILVADTDNHKIKKFTREGELVWEVGGYGGALHQLRNPHSVAVGSDGRVYVADTQNQRVVVLDEDGTALYTVGSSGNGDGQFRFNRSVTVDPVDESLWVSDSIRGVVQHFTNDGTFLGSFGAAGSGDDQLLRAADVEVNDQYVFVADVDANNIKIWTKDGTFVGAASGTGRQLGQVLNPHGMDIAPDGTLYVAEQTGDRVTQFTLTTIPVDAVAPTVSPTTPAADEAVPLPTITIGGQATDNSGIRQVDVAVKDKSSGLFLRADGSWGAFQWLPSDLTAPEESVTDYRFTFTAPTAGGYWFMSRATDLAGNLSEEKPLRQFQVYDPAEPSDITAPTVEQTAPANNSTVNDAVVELTGTAYDDDAVALVEVALKDTATGAWLRPDGTFGGFAWLPTSLSSPDTTETDFSFAFQPPAAGTYGWLARAVDASGNVTDDKPWRIFTTQ